MTHKGDKLYPPLLELDDAVRSDGEPEQVIGGEVIHYPEDDHVIVAQPVVVLYPPAGHMKHHSDGHPGCDKESSKSGRTSLPPIWNPGTPEPQDSFGRLNQLGDHSKIFVSRMVHSNLKQHQKQDFHYILSDMAMSPLYRVNVHENTGGCCCGTPVNAEDVLTVTTTSLSGAEVLKIETREKITSCYITSFEARVKIPPHTTLGIVEGDYMNGYHVKLDSGEKICTVERLSGEPYSVNRHSPYAVRSTTSIHDTGTVESDKDGYFVVTFPRTFDTHRRVMLLSCVIYMRFQMGGVETVQKENRSGCCDGICDSSITPVGAFYAGGFGGGGFGGGGCDGGGC